MARPSAVGSLTNGFGEWLPKNKQGMKECYPLDKTAVRKSRPLCINEREPGRGGCRWMERLGNIAAVMGDGWPSLTAAPESIRPANS